MRVYYTCLCQRTNKIKKSTGTFTFLVSLIYRSIRLSIYLTIVTNLVCTYTFIDIFHLLEIDIITDLHTYLIKKSTGILRLFWSLKLFCWVGFNSRWGCIYLMIALDWGSIRNLRGWGCISIWPSVQPHLELNPTQQNSFKDQNNLKIPVLFFPDQNLHVLVSFFYPWLEMWNIC